MNTAIKRAERAGTDKFALRRRSLAEAALEAIAERGFARTGLREIAQHSELSHGSLHYYFTDKNDLIAEAVRISRGQPAERYAAIIETATTPDELAGRVADEMARSLKDDASLHRLWYDLRNQALFESGFGDTIEQIEQMLQEAIGEVLARYAELAGKPCRFDATLAYALTDGMLQNALIRHLRGDTEAISRLRQECLALFAACV
ncbi:MULTISPECIES: TetR/AcrR family transcriptional regulator [Microbacterium]|uniref:TetR/AcrR family transcriptional regulator n=1 Tax=Microbacterium sufflavum TaxID=2851649 RepID=A0ABY4IHD8_9MICO|nr:MULTISPECIES: TetR/AcrR family transcriptional regulator [Microbacterium]MBN6190911.1 TetR/AcrR family transcriptional regulator [Aneurinibacillus sp. BA2021]UPL11045.1 TetR/AcrR family transcriptional regulator [Microbacterium sufflavum]